MMPTTRRGALLGAGLVLWVSLAAADAAPPEPQCVTAFGQTACGHGCVANNGVVRCAQTPQGVCTSGAGTVACWDPPAVVRTTLKTRVPSPSCLASAGQIACGYHCATAFDKVACAQTPFGACRADQGTIVCADPPAAVIAERRERTPTVQCISQSGAVACGYKCAANDGQAKCAQTPDGMCRYERDTLFCWDPPEATRAMSPASDIACLNAGARPACGYHCLAAGAQAACAQTALGTCAIERGAVVCRDPASP